jgi:hypothetical protein
MLIPIHLFTFLLVEVLQERREDLVQDHPPDMDMDILHAIDLIDTGILLVISDYTSSPTIKK